MRNLCKRTLQLLAKMRRLKIIDRAADKYIRIKSELERQQRVVNALERDYYERYGECLRTSLRCSECKYLKVVNKAPVYAVCERQKLTFLLWEADTREHSCSYGELKK